MKTEKRLILSTLVFILWYQRQVLADEAEFEQQAVIEANEAEEVLVGADDEASDPSDYPTFWLWVNALIALGLGLTYAGVSGGGADAGGIPPDVSIDDVAVQEGDDGTTDTIFTASLSASSSQLVSVDFTTSDGSAIAPADYIANTGTFSFNPGEVSKKITLDVVGDTIDEFDEIFNISLQNAVNANIADNKGIDLIIDDDDLPAISINDVSVFEGDSGTTQAIFTVTLDRATEKMITVKFTSANGTAIVGVDYVTAVGMLSFTTGETSQTVTVDVIGDTLHESDETFTVTLTNPVNSTLDKDVGTGTIINDDPLPVLSIDNVTVTESDTTATFTVSLSGPAASDVIVSFATVDDSATSGGDASLGGDDYDSKSGSVTITAGSTLATIDITINDDTVFEGDESYFVNLTGVSGPASISDSTGVGTILDDETTPTISINNVTVTEADTTANFTVSLSGPADEDVVVSFATADDSATSGGDASLGGDDYDSQTGSVTITAGSTSATVDISINDDTVFEGDEDYFVNLTGVSGPAIISDSTGVGTIIDNETTPTISIDDVTVTEAETTATFTVSLSGPADSDVVVSFATEDVSATSGGDASLGGDDYDSKTSSVTITAGLTSATVDISINDDTVFEGDETYLVNLTGVSGPAIISDSTGVGTILDDETTPTISINNVTVTEADTTATFTVSLSGPADSDVIVSFATDDSSATSGGDDSLGGDDYDSLTGSVTITAGLTSATVDISINDDTVFEGDETYLVSLTGVSGPAIISDSTGVGTILDDETKPTVTIDDVTVVEADTTATFTVLLSGPADTDVVVSFATEDGTATSGGDASLGGDDYDSKTGSVTITAGSTSTTVGIKINDDTVFEGNESYFVSLTGVSGPATISDATGVGTIIDNDPLALSDLDGTNGFVINGVDASDKSGLSVSAAGDVNGDGLHDVIIGENGSVTSDANAYVVFGQTSFSSSFELSDINGTNGFLLDGLNLVSKISPQIVSSAGDIDGDGFADVIVGSPFADTFNRNNNGESLVVFGKSDFTGTTTVTLSSLDGTDGFSVGGRTASDHSGRTVSTAGDVNGDGLADVIIGAQDADRGVGNEGESYVVFGAMSGFGSSFDLSTLDGTNGFLVKGSSGGDQSGYSVSHAGDINGDGLGDVIIGAPFADLTNKVNAGESYVIFGRTSGFSTTLDLSALSSTDGFTINGVSQADQSGFSVSGAGDVNGDGFADIIIGARAANSFTGKSHVVFGKSMSFGTTFELSDLNGSNGFTLNGIDANDRSGRSVSHAGDFNGDGFDDLIIGAYLGDNAINAGEAYLVFGDDSGFGTTFELSSLVGSDGFKLIGSDGSDLAGFSVSDAGDVNGDGFDDLIIGAFGGDPNNRTESGESYVVFGFDFRGEVDFLGASGDDSLTATSANDILIGGLGDDTLSNNGNAGTVMNGAAGDDVILLSDVNSDLTIDASDFAQIKGGTGTDVLELDGSSLTLDLTTTAPTLRIDGIEVFDLGNTNNLLILDDLSVLNMSDESNTLQIDGSNSDSIDAGTGWTATGTVVIDSVNYTQYQQGQAVLRAESVINVTITTAATTDDLLIQGADGNDSLSGSNGDDTVDGGAGDDTLTGGSGDDLFIFEKGDGANVVTDFDEFNNAEKIDVSDLGTNLVDLLNNTSIDSGNAIIDLSTLGGSAGDKLTLVGVSDKNDLDANDFIF